MARGRVRNSEQVVAELCRQDLPDATLASKGSAAVHWPAPEPRANVSWSDEGHRGSLVKAGIAHPYRPDAVDDWLRERAG